MKRIPFYKPSGLFLSILMLVFAFTSCKKQITDTTAPEEFATARAASASLSSVSLSVTLGDAVGDKITSDGPNPYINGQQYVQAVLDKNGQFVFDTYNSSSPKATVIRSLSFVFDNLISGTGGGPATNNNRNYHIETVTPTTITGWKAIQNLATNESECVSLRAWGLTGGTIDWRMLLHAGFDDRIDNTTAYAQVTRTGTNTWTITPLGTCLLGVANEAAFRSGDAQTLYGHYSMPFSLTLTKL